MLTQTTLSRGLRNRNPLNIRRTNDKWKGLSDIQSDAQFFQFQSYQYGFRAAFIILRGYLKAHSSRRACSCLYDIIERWAPPIENNTKDYVDFVSSQASIDPFQPLRFSDKNTLCAIVRQMAKFECGYYFPLTIISEGYNLAISL